MSRLQLGADPYRKNDVPILGRSAPFIPAANTSLIAKDIGRDVTFNGGSWTLTLPDPTTIYPGWSTGILANNDPLTYGTIQPPSGVTMALDGISAASLRVLYRQRMRVFLMPDNSYQVQFFDRSPLLLCGSLAGVATFDLRIPAGYAILEIDFCSVVVGTNAAIMNFLLSSNGGSSFRTGSTDYTSVIGTTATNAAYGALLPALANTALYNNAANYRGQMDCSTGTCIGHTGRTASGGTYTVEAIATRQNGGTNTYIVPNYVRFGCTAGVINLTGAIRGVPAI